jgi:long-chain acyl-CoA synthetase
MREWAKVRLSAYKAPRLFHVVDALPKGPTGKVLKREIDRRVVGAEARVAR